MSTYPVNTLWEAHRGHYMLWALCRGCGHVARIDPFDLIRKTRESDKDLWEISKFLKCKSCSHHHSVLIPSFHPRMGARRNER